MKLGRNPGGSAAARTLTTDENGIIQLGTLERGSYYLLFASPAKPSDPVVLDVEISGAPDTEPTTYRYNRKSASILLRNGLEVRPSATDRTKAPEPEKMTFESDGVKAMKVQIVKLKSNITNN